VDARRVAEAFGADHTEIRLGERDLLASLPDAIDAIDHPSGDGVNTFVVSKAVRAQGLKVALSGLGGDEMFGGYASFRRLARAEATARRVGYAPALLRRAAAGLVRSVGGGRVATEKAAAALETDGSLAAIWPVTRQLFPERRRRELLSPDWQPPGVVDDAYAPLLANAYDDAPDAGVWARVSYAESRGYMHDVLLRDTDQMSMAHGLEVRVPLLDHALVQYVVNLPDAIKARGRGPKALLAGSLPRMLPPDVSGKAKQGFVLPFDRWMRGALREYCEQQLGQGGLDGRGILRPGAASRLWRGFLAGERGIPWSRVWILVVLNAWLDRHQVGHA
jgi:asparagine synthase (glutamine-hydrolysing)